MIRSLSQDWIFQQYVKDLSKPKILPADFYYTEDGRIVLTEEYHINRGSCCGNGCRHCPYEPKHKKGNITLQDIYTKRKE
jgi:hypothetical protein